MRLKHISLTARDADRLAAFYRETFGFEDRRPPKRLSGEAVSRGNGLPSTEIYAIWLNVTGQDDPFLEIMEYSETISRPWPAVNELGYGHVALEVHDLTAVVENVLHFGGSLQGEITNFGTGEKPLLIVYARDPEGNILELEQAPVR